VRSKWILKIKKEKYKRSHWHKYPDLSTKRGKRLDKGSIWQCKCGERFELKRRIRDFGGAFLDWTLIEKELG
jgi:hypothetical protein